MTREVHHVETFHVDGALEVVGRLMNARRLDGERGGDLFGLVIGHDGVFEYFV